MIEPKISIIIPMISLGPYERECVAECLLLNYSNYQVILLPDAEIKFPEPWAADPKLKVIATGPGSIAAKRNTGMKNSADAAYYAFIDSDAYPDRNWLKNAMAGFAGFPAAAMVGGPNLCPPEDKKNFKKRIVSQALKSILVSGFSAKNFRDQGGMSGLRPYLPTCNLVVRRETAQAIGGFDERYTTGEDMKFCQMALKENKRIFFLEDVLVYHHNRSLWGPFIRQRLAYGASVPQMIRDHFSFVNCLYLFPAAFVIAVLCWAAVSFFHPFFLKAGIVMLFLYGLVVLSEACRWSSQIRDIPLTLVAVIIGNLAPAVGTIIKIFNLPFAAHSVYRERKNGGGIQQAASQEIIRA